MSHNTICDLLAENTAKKTGITETFRLRRIYCNLQDSKQLGAWITWGFKSAIIIFLLETLYCNKRIWSLFLYSRYLFQSRVNKSHPLHDCWCWLATLNKTKNKFSIYSLIIYENILKACTSYVRKTRKQPWFEVWTKRLWVRVTKRRVKYYTLFTSCNHTNRITYRTFTQHCMYMQYR